MVDDAHITETILATVRERGPTKSTCPSEIARMLFPENWRPLMQRIRDKAIQLQRSGAVRITQKGEEIDVDDFKGPIRIQLPKE